MVTMVHGSKINVIVPLANVVINNKSKTIITWSCLNQKLTYNTTTVSGMHAGSLQ